MAKRVIRRSVFSPHDAGRRSAVARARAAVTTPDLRCAGRRRRTRTRTGTGTGTGTGTMMMKKNGTGTGMMMTKKNGNGTGMMMTKKNGSGNGTGTGTRTVKTFVKARPRAGKIAVFAGHGSGDGMNNLQGALCAPKDPGSCHGAYNPPYALVINGHGRTRKDSSALLEKWN